ncbi:hypothetical protein HYR99_01110 [Candidatus Poribacteria bacterium]|nr:hypothetical protein [Candidatus Poribacteria bacterium]
MAGGHPYLTQAAASLIWEAYQKDETFSAHRYERIGWEFYEAVEAHFFDTWRNWDNANRKVVTVIALEQMKKLMNHQFSIKSLMKNPDDFATKRKKLAVSQAFIWWLADELRRNVRDDSEFDKWLQRYEMGLLFTQGEKEKLSQLATRVVNVIGQGASTLIQSFAKGFGENLAKGMSGKKV